MKNIICSPVLVTGATGFIGRYVVEELLKYGCHVTAIAGKHRPPFMEHKNLCFLSADIRIPHEMENLRYRISSCRSVLHLAADIRIPGDADSFLTNTIGTCHILQLAEQLQIQNGIYLSSVPVTGDPVYTPLTEDHPVHPVTAYHVSKYAGEQLAEIKNRGTACWKIIRIPSPVGRGMPHTFFRILLEKMVQNDPVEIFGNGSRVQTYIDVRDIATGIVNAMEKPVKGLFLFSGNVAVSDLDLALQMKEILGSKSEIIWNKRPNPDDGICWSISDAKAKNQLDYRPKYRLTDTIRWMMQTTGNV